MRQLAAIFPDPRVADALRVIEWGIMTAPWNTTDAYQQARSNAYLQVHVNAFPYCTRITLLDACCRLCAALDPCMCLCARRPPAVEMPRALLPAVP